MKDLLVGSTGFVGTNLKKAHNFELACHSADVRNYYGAEPDLCVYAGVPSAMYLANSDPDADLAVVKNALTNLKAIRPKKLVLISTVAVYDMPQGVDENSVSDLTALPAYGRNRALLEEWIKTDFSDAVIVRLPALYGEGLKKNFLYDIHTIIPAMLKSDKYEELSRDSNFIRLNYIPTGNGFYKLSGEGDIKELKLFFEGNDFNALSFTDSRSRYQFYNLGRLWSDICLALESDVKLLNLVTPPVSALELYQIIMGKSGWENKLHSYYDYDVRTVHGDIFGGSEGYICSMEDELRDVVGFMDAWKGKNT